MDKTQEILEHFGVKGMKWGVRKQSPSGSGDAKAAKSTKKIDKKYQKQFKGTGGWIKVNNTFADSINPKLDLLNNNPKYKGKNLSDSSSALYKSYMKDFEKLVDRAAAETTTKLAPSIGASKRLVVTRVGEGENSGWAADFEDIKHSLMPKVKVNIKKDSLGHIISFELEVDQDSLAQAEEFLEHFGVKGMRWGVRKDLSSSASKRESKDSEDSAAADAALAKVKTYGTKSLTNAELEALVKRLDLEKRFVQNKNGPKKTGRKMTEEILQQFAKQQAAKLLSYGVSKAIEAAKK